VKVVRNTTWRDAEGVVHVAFWGLGKGPWGYHRVCDGKPLAVVDERSAYVDDGHPTCVRCVSGS
jgi:hypothetical protein